MTSLYLTLGLIAAAAQSAPAADSAKRDEFFERSIPPLPAPHCYRCHDKGEKSKGALQLNSRENALKGGDRGPAIVPGDPDASLLIQAVRRTGDLKMPPDTPLSEVEVSALTRWIKEDAHWPAAAPNSAAADRSTLWSLAPVADPPIPDVVNNRWPQTPIDRFLLHRMEQEKIAPSAPTDPLTWLRRVTFDLVGLPPDPADCRDFLADDRPDARARVVDRLLASPRYGERWARHWLDVVRYAETNGFEDDTEKPNAFRYRDYVIDAFNQDLPFDQFVREQIAGDLLPSYRLGPDAMAWQSPIGSGFWWLGEIMALPFCEKDLLVVKGNEIENQIDTYGKAFLGLTLACARCHDHKFDPISSEDYYAVAGAVASTTNVQQCIETKDRYVAIESHQARLEADDDRIRALLDRGDIKDRILAARRQEARKIHDYLVALAELVRTKGKTPIPAGLDPARIKRWREILIRPDGRQNPFLVPLSRLLASPPDTIGRRSLYLSSRLTEMNDSVPKPDADAILGDFENGVYSPWKAAGHAFGPAPQSRRDGVFVNAVGEGYASSYRSTDALTGRLVSPTFKVGKKRQFLCFYIAGGDSPKTCVNLVLHSQAMPQLAPFWSTSADRSDVFSFRYFDLHFYEGMELFIEVVDDDVGDWGHIAVDHFFLSETAPPADYSFCNSVAVQALAGAQSISDFAAAFRDLGVKALELDDDLPNNEQNRPWLALRDWLNSPASPLLSDDDIERLLDENDQNTLRQCKRTRKDLEQSYPKPIIAMVSKDRPIVRDARVQLSASPEELGDSVRRGRPLRLARQSPSSASADSGRLDLALWTSSPQNPLVRRVLVNRLWHHHFGRGLVPTPDNFGNLGERPTNPELLDYLASRFLECQWSIKAMHRDLVSSAAYALSSKPNPTSYERDQANRFCHYFPIRRLEAECIRDAVLAVTGSLDFRIPDSSLALPITENYMLDPVETPGAKSTERCRSIYLQARRNNLPTLFQAFDYPQLPVATGSRNASSVPEQALVMLNGEFASALANAWAERLTAVPASDQSRIENAYWSALGRPPTPGEVQTAVEFLRAQKDGYVRSTKSENPDLSAWADLCHVILNLSEFIFVR